MVRVKMLLDLVVISAIILTVENRFVYPSHVRFSSFFLLVWFGNLATWFLCARSFGLYADLRLKPFSIEGIMFLKAFGLYALITSFIAFQVFNHYPYGRHQFLTQCALLFFFLPAQRLLVRVVSKELRNRRNVKRKVLIIGAGKTGLYFYENCVQNRHYGYQLTGFLDDTVNPKLNGYYLGKPCEIETVIARHELDEVVVTLPINNETAIKNIISISEQQGKRVRIIPNYECFSNGRMQVDRVGNISMISLHSLPLDSIDNKIYKRVFDVVFSLLVILFVFSWLFPIIALLIRFTSKGAVFFKQERWGLNNKTIICWKFRTMVEACGEESNKGEYKQAVKNDVRTTRIGRFLRKTSLDELPQFINVLLGSMSVVGPRPHPVPLNEISKNFVEGYKMRHWVKPGITGWAQVHGYRGETRTPYLMKKRVEHDFWYMEHWTPWLDLQIVLQTLANLVKGEENAY